MNTPDTQTAPLRPSTPYRCLRCGFRTTLGAPCGCVPQGKAGQPGLDLPSFLAGGLVFTALFLVMRFVWWFFA